MDGVLGSAGQQLSGRAEPWQSSCLLPPEQAHTGVPVLVLALPQPPAGSLCSPRTR